jgi:hypothetical protein
MKLFSIIWLMSYSYLLFGYQINATVQLLLESQMNETSVTGIVMSILNDPEFLSLDTGRQLRILLIIYEMLEVYKRREFPDKIKTRRIVGKTFEKLYLKNSNSSLNLQNSI